MRKFLGTEYLLWFTFCARVIVNNNYVVCSGPPKGKNSLLD